MKCPKCDKPITEKRIKEALRKRKGSGKARDSHRIYCNRTCFESRGDNSKDLCTECGVNQKNIAAKRCGVCRHLGVSQLRLDSEIKELVVLNPGAGFDYFIDMVFSRASIRKTGRWYIRRNLLQFFEDLQEIEGVDYASWLQNPDAMIRVKIDEVPDDREKYIRGQRRTQVSRMVQRQRVRAGLSEGKANVSVKIPPEFRWGKYKPL
jgi:hypothetical protein